MSDFLMKYYEGITQQLRTEVELINSLITTHQGLKGTGNENALRELLTEFLPRRFAVDTGMIVDNKGKTSRQIDLVIYDALEYPALFSMAGVHLFPIDNVYATIEVKTTLDTKSAKEAIQNIRSVQELELVRVDLETMIYYTPPKPPLGLVFAYRSLANRKRPLPATVKRWFKPKSSADAPLYPSAVACLDQGIIARGKHFSLAEDEIKLSAMPILTSSGGTLDMLDLKKMPAGGIYTDSRGFMYPVIKLVEDGKSHYFPIDPARILLNFLLSLNDTLVSLHIDRASKPRVMFSRHYLGDPLKLSWSI